MMRVNKVNNSVTVVMRSALRKPCTHCLGLKGVERLDLCRDVIRDRLEVTKNLCCLLDDVLVLPKHA